MPEFDEFESGKQWNQVPLETVDLGKEGEWVVGFEFLREEGSDRARIRGFAVDEEGVDYYYEPAASTGGEEKLSQDDLFDVLPQEVGVVMENAARAAAVANMIGLNREEEVLIAAEGLDVGEEGHVFDIRDEQEEHGKDEPLRQGGVMDMRMPMSKKDAKEIARAAVRFTDVDQWSQQTVINGMVAEMNAMEEAGDREGASAALDRLIDFQRGTAENVEKARDTMPEDTSFSAKEAKRRDKSGKGKKGGDKGEEGKAAGAQR